MFDKKTLQRASAMLGEAKDLVEGVRDSARDAYDEKSENWHNSDAGRAVDEKITGLDEAIDNLEQAIESIDNAAT